MLTESHWETRLGGCCITVTCSFAVVQVICMWVMRKTTPGTEKSGTETCQVAER